MKQVVSTSDQPETSFVNSEGPTDGPTDTVTYGVACTRLKWNEERREERGERREEREVRRGERERERKVVYLLIQFRTGVDVESRIKW